MSASQSTCAASSAPGSSAAGGVARLSIAALALRIFYRAFGILLEWQRRAGTRQRLASLSDEALKDIGLTRIDVMREASKPFWRS